MVKAIRILILHLLSTTKPTTPSPYVFPSLQECLNLVSRVRVLIPDPCVLADFDLKLLALDMQVWVYLHSP